MDAFARLNVPFQRKMKTTLIWWTGLALFIANETLVVSPTTSDCSNRSVHPEKEARFATANGYICLRHYALA